MVNEPNFLEVIDVSDANKVDLSLYAFVTFANSKNSYIFKKRRGR